MESKGPEKIQNRTFPPDLKYAFTFKSINIFLVQDQMFLEEREISSVFLISVDSPRGLYLTWNLQGLISDNIYYKHLFLIDQDDFDIASKFISRYYLKMNNGDIFGSIVTSSASGKLRWVEKSDFQPEYHLQQSKSNEVHHTMLEILEKAIDQIGNTSTLIVNIIQTQGNKQEIQQKVMYLQQIQTLQFIVNYFGHYKYQNDIDTSTGINHFKLSYKSIENALPNFLKWYYSQIVVRSAELDIECLNGSISLQHTNSLNSYAFNRIRRQYFGLTRCETSDNISFDICSRMETMIRLKVKIIFTLLNGNSYSNQSQIEINPDRFYERTQYYKDLNELDCCIKNLEFIRNPFESNHIVSYHIQGDQDQK